MGEKDRKEGKEGRVEEEKRKKIGSLREAARVSLDDCIN